MGRPTGTTKENNRKFVVSVRYTKAEFDALLKRAGDKHLSTYIREVTCNL